LTNAAHGYAVYSTGEPKPGVCPSDVSSVRAAGLCVEECSHDRQCPNDEKCCSNGCGHQCTAPYKGEQLVSVEKAFLFIIMYIMHQLYC